MNKTPTTHASGGDTLVRVRRRACPRAGGFPTSSRIPFPTIVRLPAGGVFASTQHLIGAGRATPERTPHDMGSTPSRSTLPGVPRASGSRRGLRDAKGADIRAAPYVAAHARAGSSAWENTGLSSAVVIGRGAEGREAEAVQPSNKTLEAPQYADGPGRRPAREGYADGVDCPVVVGSSPTRPTQYRSTITADASHPRGARPNLLELCLHPSACAVVESGPVRAATLDDNAHDELQE